MKKVLLIIGLAVAAMTVNAQLYVGGELGFSFGKVKPNQGDATKSSGFTFGPEVGYSLSDKFDVGAEILFSTEKEVNANDLENKTTGWAIAPYARYAVAEFGKFKVLGKGQIGFGGFKNEADLGGGFTAKTETTVFNVGIAPLLTYSLSDNFVLLTELNFLEVGFTSAKVKDGNTTTNFGFGINSNDVFNVGAITVGFAYIF